VGFMRMRYGAGAEEEFGAGCGLLVERLVRWAGEQGVPVDAFLVEAALEYRHRATVDGRLGLWEPGHVEEVLLRWFPQQVTELPGEEPGDGPGTLRVLLCFLRAVELADPRGPALGDSLGAVDTAEERYPTATADRTRWGLAKFWTVTAAEHGVDVGDEAALQRFAERARRGEIVHDQRVLDAIVERRLSGRALGDGVRAEPQLPVVLPADGELRLRAEAVTIVAQLRGLAQWGDAEADVRARLRRTLEEELLLPRRVRHREPGAARLRQGVRDDEPGLRESGTSFWKPTPCGSTSTGQSPCASMFSLAERIRSGAKTTVTRGSSRTSDGGASRTRTVEVTVRAATTRVREPRKVSRARGAVGYRTRPRPPTDPCLQSVSRSWLVADFKLVGSLVMIGLRVNSCTVTNHLYGGGRVTDNGDRRGACGTGFPAIGWAA